MASLDLKTSYNIEYKVVYFLLGLALGAALSFGGLFWHQDSTALTNWQANELNKKMEYER